MYRFLRDVSRQSAICFPTSLLPSSEYNIVCSSFLSSFRKENVGRYNDYIFLTFVIRLTYFGYFNLFEPNGTICISRDGFIIIIIRYINYNTIIELYFTPSDLLNNRLS